MKALRYMMAAVLVLAMLCAGAAMAATITQNPVTVPLMSNPTTGCPVPEGTALINLFTIEPEADEVKYDWGYEVKINGTWKPVSTFPAALVPMSGTGVSGTTIAGWDYENTADMWQDMTGEEQVRLTVVAYGADGKVIRTTSTGTFYVDWNTDPAKNDRLTFAYWLPHNTACVYGPKMNVLVPGIGSKDNITAAVVDLTKEGTQTFKLVAADQWEIGKVFVNVNGDEVTVTYQMTEDINTRDIWDEIVVEKEWFTIFGSKAAITSANRDDLGDGYAFGAPISIANDLGGATTVVLYVNSTVTYGAHNPYVYRFWTNSRYETGARDAMLELYNSVAD